jgi:hypothetical protein
VFVSGLRREVQDQVQFTSKLPFRSRIFVKETSYQCSFTRIIDQFQGSSPSTEPVPMVMTQRCINDFSAPSRANIKTGPEMNVGDSNFELKPALMNMVQQSPLCGKASKDPNAHLQHFLEICSRFTIHGVPQDAVHLRLFHSHCWERRSNGSTPIKKLCPPGRSSPMHFQARSFR